jgi:hypothetical protein
VYVNENIWFNSLMNIFRHRFRRNPLDTKTKPRRVTPIFTVARRRFEINPDVLCTSISLHQPHRKLELAFLFLFCVIFLFNSLSLPFQTSLTLDCFFSFFRGVLSGRWIPLPEWLARGGSEPRGWVGRSWCIRRSVVWGCGPNRGLEMRPNSSRRSNTTM